MSNLYTEKRKELTAQFAQLMPLIEEERQAMSRKADAEIQRFFMRGGIDGAVKRALMDRVINVTLEGCSVSQANTGVS